MYVMQRGDAFWVSDTAEEMWQSLAFQLRLRTRKDSVKTLEEFQRRLDDGERVGAGGYGLHFIIVVWKCKPEDEADILLRVKKREDAEAAFRDAVEKAGGYIFY
jgi:hypothetical protein